MLYISVVADFSAFIFYVAIGYRVNSLERFESLPHIGSEIKHALLARKPSNSDSKTAPRKRLVD